MRYLYLIKLDAEQKRSFAYRTPDKVTLDEYIQAEEHGYKWVNEEEGIELGIEIPNHSGNWAKLIPSRTFDVPVKLEDRAIWCNWVMKWYAIWEYRPFNKKPSAAVMENVRRVFHTNTGLAVNHEFNFIWEVK